MRQLQPVIWSKGVFLSPQHLQAQERFVEESARFYLDSIHPHGWGFLDFQIDAKALSEGMLSISRATGIFPDALTLDIPGSDAAPPARMLDECFSNGRKSCVFYLGVPQYLHGRMNVSLTRNRVSTRFLAQMQMVRDENTGEKDRPVQLAQKNLRLFAEGENLEGVVLLGCARVLRSPAGMYELDGTYIPPLLDVHAHPQLKQMLGGLVELLITRESQLSGARRQKNQSLAEFTASDIAPFWLLYTINTHLPGLRHFFESRNIAPQLLYSELVEFTGALTAFSDKIDPRDVPAYDHKNLGACFGELDRLLRLLLETVVPSNFVALPLKQTGETIYTTSIDRDAYFEGSAYYLAVTSDLRDADLIDRVPKLLKTSAPSRVETLVRNALPGVRLQHVPTPPRAIPVKLRQQYFAIQKSGEYWEEIRRERRLSVYAPVDILNPQMELVILLSKPL